MCKYCFIGKLNTKTMKMKKETLLNAIVLFNLHLESINEGETIFFYGAEPLLNFELIKFGVNYIKKKNYNIKFSMVSNGILLNE